MHRVLVFSHATVGDEATVRHPRKRISQLGDVLRQDVVGGVLLLLAAVTALVWANSGWSEHYHDLRAWTFGPESLHLNLSLAAWAADGLLAIFFFVVALELKREFVHGELRDLRRAAVPVLAAICGIAAPALVYVTVNVAAGSNALDGWAIPAATDIAFALAVLAVIGRNLPSSLRIFLLTLAVVDDLIAITIIAVVYTSSLSFAPLLAAVVPLALFAWLVRRYPTRWWLLIPVGLVMWALVHAAGVHATIAGVALGLVVPAAQWCERYEHAVRPISAGFAVPVFAFLAAGVTVGGLSGLMGSLSEPVTLGIVGGLVLGKVVGIAGITLLIKRYTRSASDLHPADVCGIALLAGIGFTVSLLIGDLAFDSGAVSDQVRIGVLTGSLISALCGAAILGIRNRAYRRLDETRTSQ
ncbi:NhaA family Na+:H+ antiporter [Mycolicibacterium iranicum]|uniref:Na(+)/H(+) antiporter NhaA n=1 Tax=Mycolicibacterium iranicum TaxID=912594 RepID=A0A839Q5Q1_MYCIR|nr:NhaA family Na+:H+ antiporter [Mycolicibacterium iranicum]